MEEIYKLIETITDLNNVWSNNSNKIPLILKELKRILYIQYSMTWHFFKKSDILLFLWQQPWQQLGSYSDFLSLQ